MIKHNSGIMQINTIFNLVQSKFFSEQSKKRGETFIVIIALFSFVFHLLLIGLVHFNIIYLDNSSHFFSNPIAAIYTPFSFILVYEVYLLVYYLPKSTTIYIGKQYEIMALIVIRKVFKDLSQLELTSDWFSQKPDMVFTVHLLATLILFFLIFVFYRLNEKKDELEEKKTVKSPEINQFIKIKNRVASILIPIFLFLALYIFGQLIYESIFSLNQLVSTFNNDVTRLFFNDFFTILILTDVFLLLFSLLHTDKFRVVIRNSGYIISTILLKMSFGVEGVLNAELIVIAVLFGVAILAIHNQYLKIGTSKKYA